MNASYLLARVTIPRLPRREKILPWDDNPELKRLLKKKKRERETEDEENVEREYEGINKENKEIS